MRLGSNWKKEPSFPRKRESSSDFIQDLNLWMPACAGMTNYDTASIGEGISLYFNMVTSPLAEEGSVKGASYGGDSFFAQGISCWPCIGKGSAALGHE
jgi:hypothetical protein